MRLFHKFFIDNFLNRINLFRLFIHGFSKQAPVKGNRLLENGYDRLLEDGNHRLLEG